MASKSYLRHQMADHKNWSPAIHFQELGEIENVKHTFELKLPPDITEAQKDELLGHLEQIVEERDLGYEYHAFFHYHGQGRNKETYFVVATKSSRFVNSITTIYQKDPIKGQENRFYDIGSFQDKILYPEIVRAGVTYVITEAGSVHKEQRENSAVSKIPRNIDFFAKADFEGIER